MADIKIVNDISIDKNGTVGNILSGYIENFISTDEISKINKKIELLNAKNEGLNIFSYKIANRVKIRNLIVKTISEDSDVFIDIASELMNMSEENFENVIDSFMSLTKSDIDTLYYNLWKKRENSKFDVIELKGIVENEYEFRPDLIFNHEYRVNKVINNDSKNSLIVGESLTIMPTQESSNIFNVFEKLAFNNFIKITKYIPNSNLESFPTYLCFNFTYLGIHVCKIMEKIEKRREVL